MILPIAHTFGPLVTIHALFTACKSLCTPWQWKNGKQKEKLRTVLQDNMNQHVSLFATGREALLALLQSMDIAQGDEIILQAYTCVVVPNAIIAAGAVPIYCDISTDTLNLDIQKIAACITPKTRAIICQHTFGIPADTVALRTLCDEHSLALIEDCAHTLGTDQYPVGYVGDAAILSFGRDKAISGVSGGAVLTRHALIAKALERYEHQAIALSYWTMCRYGLYPPLYFFAKTLWWTKCSKALLRCMQVCKLLVPITTDAEKKGSMSNALHAMPNICASMALSQWVRREAIKAKRIHIAKLYNAISPPLTGIPDGIPLQKYPLFMKDASNVRAQCKRAEIYLDDGWCAGAINPKGVQEDALQYTRGACPCAEWVAVHIVSLPVHPTMQDVQVKHLLKTIGRIDHEIILSPACTDAPIPQY